MRSLGAAQDWWEAGAHWMRARRMRADLIGFCERRPLSWADFAQVDGRSESDAEAGWSGAKDQAERSG